MNVNHHLWAWYPDSFKLLKNICMTYPTKCIKSFLLSEFLSTKKIMVMFTAQQLSFSRNISCRQLWLSSVARTKSNWFRWLWLWIIIHTKSLGIPRTPKYPTAQNPVRHAMQPAQNPPRGNCTKNSAGQKWSWPEQETVQKPFIKYWNRVSPFCNIL